MISIDFERVLCAGMNATNALLGWHRQQIVKLKYMMNLITTIVPII